jgi:hypothetical protein
MTQGSQNIGNDQPHSPKGTRLYTLIGVRPVTQRREQIMGQPKQRSAVWPQDGVCPVVRVSLTSTSKIEDDQRDPEREEGQADRRDECPASR